MLNALPCSFFSEVLAKVEEVYDMYVRQYRATDREAERQAEKEKTDGQTEKRQTDRER